MSALTPIAPEAVTHRTLYTGLIRLHILHHAAEGQVYLGPDARQVHIAHA